MSTEKESLDELKKRIHEIRTELAHGVHNPEHAAQHMCNALLMIADAAEHFLQEAEDDQDQTKATTETCSHGNDWDECPVCCH